MWDSIHRSPWAGVGGRGVEYAHFSVFGCLAERQVGAEVLETVVAVRYRTERYWARCDDSFAMRSRVGERR